MLVSQTAHQRSALAVLIAFHILIIIASNYLVQLPAEQGDRQLHLSLIHI